MIFRITPDILHDDNVSHIHYILNTLEGPIVIDVNEQWMAVLKARKVYKLNVHDKLFIKAITIDVIKHFINDTEETTTFQPQELVYTAKSNTFLKKLSS